MPSSQRKDQTLGARTDQHEEVARAGVVQPRDLLVVALKEIPDQVGVHLAVLLAMPDVVDPHEQREEALAPLPLHLLRRGHEVALERVDLADDVARPRVDERGVGDGGDAGEVEGGVGEAVGLGEVVDPVERAGLGLRRGARRDQRPGGRLVNRRPAHLDRLVLRAQAVGRVVSSGRVRVTERAARPDKRGQRLSDGEDRPGQARRDTARGEGLKLERTRSTWPSRC